MPVSADRVNSWTLARAVGGAAVLAVVASVRPALAGEEPGYRFVDVTDEAGATARPPAFGEGNGVAAADFDGDGHVDLFVPARAGLADQLFRNQGDGSFVDVAPKVGLGGTGNSRGGLWLDFDGDGDLDLLIQRDAWDDPHDGKAGAEGDSADSPLQLFRQHSDGSFEDVTAGSGLDVLVFSESSHGGGLAAADVNGDGRPDICATYWGGGTRLFLSTGRAGYVDATESSGISGGHPFAWQPLFHDIDGDGLVDLFVCIDFSPNNLWMNRGDGTFQDMAPAAGVDRAFNEMGACLADLDGDGDLDLYTTNIHRTFLGVDQYSVLYRNDSMPGRPMFVDVTAAAGVGDTGWGWGTAVLDADRDGRLELVATNGYSNGPWMSDRSRLFRPVGPPESLEFLEDGAGVGFDDPFWGSGLVAADLDRDGDEDLIQVCQDGPPLRILRNDPVGPVEPAAWLTIRTRMSGANSHALGANVTVTSAGLRQRRDISAGGSFIGQQPAEAFFGLGRGPGTEVADVLIAWPDGRWSRLRAVPTGDVITVTDAGAFHRCLGDLDPDGFVDGRDLSVLVDAWGTCVACDADLDVDGSVGFSDLLGLLTLWGDCPAG